jgi:hypothetical protein
MSWSQRKPKRRALCQQAVAADRFPKTPRSGCRACRRRRELQADGTHRGVRRAGAIARRTRTYRWSSSVAEVEETVGADTIIDGHADDAVAGETTTLIPGQRTRSVILEHTAWNPHHHWLPNRSEVGSPDIEA